jgi:hypothetical protein
VIAIFDSLPAKEGATDTIVERFAEVTSRFGEGGYHLLMRDTPLGEDSVDDVQNSDEFPRAHGRSGGEGPLRGHPKMTFLRGRRRAAGREVNGAD